MTEPAEETTAVATTEPEKKDFEKLEETAVAKWKKRFDRAENFRRPYIDRNMRMYRLYRAYREATNYAYGTRLMPPVGFEIIETVKPRLASAEISVNIYPTKKEDVGKKENISRWDDLIEYDLQVINFDDLKIQWINAMLMYGNGTAQLMWEGGEDGDPFLEIVDNFLLYVDPKATNRGKDSDWEIKQSFKSKAQIESAEKAREAAFKNQKDVEAAVSEDDEDAEGAEEDAEEEIEEAADGTKKYDLDAFLYTTTQRNDATGEDEEVPMIYSKAWEDIEGSSTADDPRRQRYEINTKKMGQINDGTAVGQANDAGSGSSTDDKLQEEKMIEIWECFDHLDGKLVAIFNRTNLVRNEENPYIKVLGGRTFIDLPDISLNWEYFAMGHLEPVETTIHEIADSRNQAMDDIVFSLDPIRKVKKGSGYKDTDFLHAPGAIWYVQNKDDIVYEKLPEVSRAWVEKDTILRKEIESSLAMSEYVRGIPQSAAEPSSKVELLLTQTNIRLSLIVRQMEIAFTDLVNGLIQLNQEMLGEQKSFRILGKKFRFGEFTSEDKQMGVDASVDISPKIEKSSDQKSKEVLDLYKLLVVDDKPDLQDPAAVAVWKKKKGVLQRLLVDELGYEEYADILAPKLSETTPVKEGDDTQGGPDALSKGAPAPQPGGDAIAPELKQPIPGPEDLLPPEAGVPGATTAATAPDANTLRALMARGGKAVRSLLGR